MEDKNFTMRIISLVFSLYISTILAAQPVSNQLDLLQNELNQVEHRKQEILQDIESVKLAELHKQLITNGFPELKPKETIIHHAAMSLVYSPKHKQAKWVAHIISPDILNGQVSRSNDFRADPLVKGGTAIEEDYFLRIINENGELDFDGFGYDRGHLAPSADFRWSKRALSESYFYSNIAPQVAALNRGKWADLENLFRAYVYSEQVPLYVVTGGVLEDDLPTIERGIHQVSIPRYFWKVAIDLENKRGIGFLMPNANLEYPLTHYALAIDKIEQLTGINFYANLTDGLEDWLEAQMDLKAWLPTAAKGDVEPLPFASLPTKHYNTVIAKKQMGKGTQIYVCGTVVRARTTRKGNVILNLDKAYPNQIFDIFINKKYLVNFGGSPVKTYEGKVIRVKGIVEQLGGIPTIFVEKEEQIEYFQ